MLQATSRTTLRGYAIRKEPWQCESPTTFASQTHIIIAAEFPLKTSILNYSKIYTPNIVARGEFTLINLCDSENPTSNTHTGNMGGLTPPLSVIGNWPTPNYVNPVKRGLEVPILICIFQFISLAVVLARLWTRFTIQRAAGLDDYLIIAAIVCLKYGKNFPEIDTNFCLIDSFDDFGRYLGSRDSELRM